MSATRKTYAVTPTREKALHERMILHRKFDQRLVHQIDIAFSSHSKMQEGDQEITDAPGLHSLFHARWIIQRDVLAKLVFAQLDELRVIGGNLREVGPLKKEIDAIDLRGQKDGFGIIVRDHDPGSREQMGHIDSAPDLLRNLRVPLEEVRDRAIHKLETDLQRWCLVDLRGPFGSE